MEIKESKDSLSPSRIAWRRFKRNYPALFGLGWIILCFVLSVFAYFIIPDKTSNSNFQLREMASKPPGHSSSYLIKSRKGVSEEKTFSSYFSGTADPGIPISIQNEKAWGINVDTLWWIDPTGQKHNEFLPEWMLPIGKKKIFSKEQWSSTGKYYSLENGNIKYADENGLMKDASLASLKKDFAEKNIKQTTFHFGSDTSGRDIFSRLILGTRISLSVGFFAVLLSLLIGVTLGSIAGLFRGKVDTIIMWFTSVVWSIPTLLLAIAISYAMGGGFWQLFIAIGVSTWVDIARMVRGQVFSLRESQYVEAARAMGFSPTRIILKHILPNITGPVIVVAASNFATAILLEAGLSFLGVGVKPPTPSWGNMVLDGYSHILFDSGAWMALFPSIALTLMVISVNLVAFGLRDALDPKYDLKV